MITIKSISNIVNAEKENSLPTSLIAFLKETFKELHEAHDPEVSLDHFSLEMHGPIYVLVGGQDNPEVLFDLGLHPAKTIITVHQSEWVKKIKIGECLLWRMGVMADNDYLFHVILPVNEFGPEVEAWIEELSEDESI